MTAPATVPLWQLAADYELIAAELVESGGELTPEMIARLDALEGSFESKVERTVLLIRNITASAIAARSEADRLALMAQRRANAVDRLKGYIYECMNLAGKVKVETDLITARIQKSPPSAKCAVPVSSLPPWLVRTPEPVFDAKAALEGVKRGETLPEGVTVEQGSHLRLG